jgi:hypothetical protein
VVDGINGQGATGVLIGGAAGAGNLISGNDNGIGLFAVNNGGNNNFVEGNFLGTDVTGTLVTDGAGNSLGNYSYGMFIAESNDLISGNLIDAAGNTAIRGSGNGNQIQGNFLGADVTGTRALGISQNITFQDGGNKNTIGGLDTNTPGAPLAGNLIANGLIHLGGPMSGNMIEGNYMGTDITGMTAIGSAGVFFGDGATGNTIGGITTTAGGITTTARNIIVGNGAAGIELEGLSPTNSVLSNAIEGNYIGTGATGQVLGHWNNDIHILGGVSGTTIGGADGTGNVIEGAVSAGIALGDQAVPGGLSPSGNLIEGNVIAYNGGPPDKQGWPGVYVGTATGTSILGNSIHDNSAFGINLANPNPDQVAPMLTGVSGSSNGTTVSGSLQSLPGTTFRIEFFANPMPDITRTGQGQTFLGAANVVTDSTGYNSFMASLAVPPGQRYLSATATVVNSDGTFGDTSKFSNDLLVPINFSGFLPPLNQNMAFALNRTIPIKWQLTDVNGAPITSPSAVTSLQVAPVNADGSLGTPSNPTPAGGTSLRNDGSQYVFNWQTKGLTAGTYEIVLTLADGTQHTKVVQLTKNGSSAGLTTVATGGTGSTAGALLGGDVDVYVDNTNGDLTADEQARIQDAVTAVDAVTEPYGVAVREVSDPTQADVTLNMDTTSAVGGAAQGVLGCTTDAGQITVINGWSFYAGSDPTQIGAGQYDFQTVVTHELGHALGLGHSTDSTSVMYATLNTGAVQRSLTAADLNVPDSGTGGACGLHAAPAGPVVGSSVDAAGSSTSAAAATMSQGLPSGAVKGSPTLADLALSDLQQWLTDAALMLAAWGNPSAAGQLMTWVAAADWMQQATGTTNATLAQDWLWLLINTAGPAPQTQAL